MYRGPLDAPPRFTVPPRVRVPSAPSPPRRSELLEPLTAREAEVLDQIARGAATVQIARALSIAEATVRNHLLRILQKLGARSRLEAVAIARDAGLL